MSEFAAMRCILNTLPSYFHLWCAGSWLVHRTPPLLTALHCLGSASYERSAALEEHLHRYHPHSHAPILHPHLYNEQSQVDVANKITETQVRYTRQVYKTGIQDRYASQVQDRYASQVQARYTSLNVCTMTVPGRKRFQIHLVTALSVQ